MNEDYFGSCVQSTGGKGDVLVGGDDGGASVEASSTCVFWIG